MAEEFNEDIFDAMLSGTFEEAADDIDEIEEVESGEEEDSTIVEDEDPQDDTEDDEYDEDTDLEDDADEEDLPDDLDDGEDDEELDSEVDDEEEDTLVEDDDLDADDEDEEDDVDDTDIPSEDEALIDDAEDGTETEENNDGDAPETDGIDYKSFYDAVVNTEFTVNGRKTKGFSDPKKIIQSMQMAGGYSDKMAGFKKYRPFMAPLQERGMLDDQSKFDLAMNIIDGDKEAIKKHLQSLEIDPIDLDMEAIDYSRKITTASDASLIVDDAIERAKSGGYEDRFRQVIGKEWDEASFNEFVDNPAVRNDLLAHMETGAYDKVTDRMAEMRRLDFNGAYGNLSTISQYRAAVADLQREAEATPSKAPVAPVKAPTKTVKEKPSVKEEKAKIRQARKEAEYKKEVEAKNAKVAKQRKRATSMSKKKPKTRPAAKFDPMKVEGEELDALMEHLINGGR